MVKHTRFTQPNKQDSRYFQLRGGSENLFQFKLHGAISRCTSLRHNLTVEVAPQSPSSKFESPGRAMHTAISAHSHVSIPRRAFGSEAPLQAVLSASTRRQHGLRHFPIPHTQNILIINHLKEEEKRGGTGFRNTRQRAKVSCDRIDALVSQKACRQTVGLRGRPEQVEDRTGGRAQNLRHRFFFFFSGKWHFYLQKQDSNSCNTPRMPAEPRSALNSRSTCISFPNP